MPRLISREAFIQRAKARFGDRYNYDETVYKGQGKVVTIICNQCSVKLLISPKNHWNGSQCFTCYPRPNSAKNPQTFISEARLVHGDFYDYSKTEYTLCHLKVIVICPEHGEFQVIAGDHLYHGRGCAKCSGLLVRNTVEFKDAAIRVHGHLYDYSRSEYCGYSRKVLIRCGIHGDFWQMAANHIRGSGCSQCADTRASEKNTLSQNDFQSAARRLFGDTYDYTNTVYRGYRHEVEIFCPKHKILFKQKAGDHLSGNTGCSKCQHRKNSKKAIAWLEREAIARKIFIQHSENIGEFRIPERNYYVDGYHAESKTVFEYHGCFYHGDPRVYPAEIWNSLCQKSMGELYQRTLDRIKDIENLGFSVIQMWEYDDEVNPLRESLKLLSKNPEH